MPKALKKQHFSDQHLNKFVNGELEDASKNRLMEHLDRCAVCDQRMIELDREKRQFDSAHASARRREKEASTEQMDKEEGENAS